MPCAALRCLAVPCVALRCSALAVRCYRAVLHPNHDFEGSRSRNPTERQTYNLLVLKQIILAKKYRPILVNKIWQFFT